MKCETEQDYCVHWEDCEPCCKCGDHPKCPIDREGNCANCGRELDSEGHPKAEETVKPKLRHEYTTFMGLPIRVNKELFQGASK